MKELRRRIISENVCKFPTLAENILIAVNQGPNSRRQVGCKYALLLPEEEKFWGIATQRVVKKGRVVEVDDATYSLWCAVTPVPCFQTHYGVPQLTDKWRGSWKMKWERRQLDKRLLTRIKIKKVHAQEWGCKTNALGSLALCWNDRVSGLEGQQFSQYSRRQRVVNMEIKIFITEALLIFRTFIKLWFSTIWSGQAIQHIDPSQWTNWLWNFGNWSDKVNPGDLISQFNTFVAGLLKFNSRKDETTEFYGGFVASLFKAS